MPRKPGGIYVQDRRQPGHQYATTGQPTPATNLSLAHSQSHNVNPWTTARTRPAQYKKNSQSITDNDAQLLGFWRVTPQRCKAMKGLVGGAAGTAEHRKDWTTALISWSFGFPGALAEVHNHRHHKLKQRTQPGEETDSRKPAMLRERATAQQDWHRVAPPPAYVRALSPTSSSSSVRSTSNARWFNRYLQPQS